MDDPRQEDRERDRPTIASESIAELRAILERVRAGAVPPTKEPTNG